MRNTRQLLDALPEKVLSAVNNYKAHYELSGEARTTRKGAMSYLQALVDMEVITEREKQLLFCYITL